MFKPLHLIDLPSESDEDLMGFELFRLSAMFAKHIRDPERILQTLAQMHAFMVYLCNNGYDAQVALSIQYILQAAYTRTEDEKVLRKAIHTTLSKTEEEKMMNMAEILTRSLRAEAERQAREQGLERGMEMGVEKGLLQVAHNMLAEGMPLETVLKLTGLPRHMIEKAPDIH